jgi:hypothetical protein
MNWEDTSRLRIERGEAGRAFGTPASVVNIYWLNRETGSWERVMADMAPSILQRIGLPAPLTAAAQLTVDDGKPRALGADGRWMPIPEPPPKLRGGVIEGNVGGLQRRRRRRVDATVARRLRKVNDEKKASD